MERGKLTTRYINLLSSLLLLCLFSACQSNGGDQDPTANLTTSAGAMTTFSDDEQLLDYLKQALSAAALPRDAFLMGSPTVFFNGGDVGIDVLASPGATAPSAETKSFSGTNIQELGVDEADIVKTDGQTMYVVGQTAIQVIDVRLPSSARLLQPITVKGAIDNLYLYNNQLIILYKQQTWFGEPWLVDAPTTMMIGICREIPINSKFGIQVYDVSDPSNPVFKQDTVIDGHLVSSRLTGGKLHLISQFLPELPPLQIVYDGTEQDRLLSEQKNAALVEPLTLDSFIPSYTLQDQTGASIKTGRLVQASQFYYPQIPDGSGIVTITSFDLNVQPTTMHSVGIVANAHTIYASTQSLYLAAARWNAVQPLLDGSIDTEPQYLYSTVIHKFDISGAQVVSVGSGIVPGTVLDQFSMSEHQDVLRVATTTSPTTTRQTSSNVYTLAPTTTGLAVLGKVEGLAPGETLYAARFIDQRGFLVTFVKVDPLFTIDLTNPSQPFVAGELKVPGFSEYIHPLGADHLLTIGKDTAEQDGITWHQGLQLSIFDVSDFANPQLRHLEKIGERGSYSEALYNHKAFTFWPERNLLAIPASVTEHLTPPTTASQFGSVTFQGVYVYRVDAITGFSFVGRVDTKQLSWWTRGVFIENELFTVQPQQLFLNPLDDFTKVQTLLY